MEDPNDPFVTGTSPPDEREPRHRYSSFNSQLFALGPNASPAQAKQALEAHLAETDRRMEEAGKLGTALVQQRNELTQRLAEVEKLQAEAEVSEDLRQRLLEIEKDYNDVAKESARAFLPKPRVPSNEAAAGSAFVPEEKRGGRRSVSPSKFEAQATASPTKLSVPNRKIRNQPANRIHDIEFAAEISQSLIVQVRNLQALLAEKEEELREVKLDKSKLEYETENFQQRIKSLDESQNRYKDENWSLETQVHELEAAQRESSDREKKLQQTVSILEAEKNASQRELDEVKLNHARLTEEHTAAVKHHDTELGAAKRNIFMAESERAAMLRKIEDLTSQNSELAKAISSQRGRALDALDVSPTSEEDFATANDDNTPEHSPPMSPIKGTPRHSLLESETLKTSLQHAQRTIQSLRTNVHREKTEKLELRRMLQDARDELERVRSDPVPHKRPSKALSREFKKPPRLLGNQRSSRTEIISAADDAEWEDQPASSPAQPSVLESRPGNFTPVLESTERDYETATDTGDQAFDTANEMGAETDDFHTGAEEFTSSDDAETETESPSKRRLRGKQSSQSTIFRRSSVDSTASSTENEYGFDDSHATITHLPPLQNRFPMRASRGTGRRSRQNSEGPTFQPGAPGTPRNQSLAAELGDFDASDNDSTLSATPSRRSIISRPGSMRGITATPPPPVPRLARVPMVDDGTMTEDVEEPDTHASELESLRQEHAKEIEDLHASKAEAHAAAVTTIETRHAEELQRAVDEARAAHARELDTLKSDHADEKSKAMDAAGAAHARELEALHADHRDKMAQMQSEYSATHAAELESLKTRHADELRTTKEASATAHAAELAALVKAHTAQVELAKNELVASHAKDLDALKASHAAAIEQSKQTSDSAHTEELAALQATHLAQVEETKKSIAAAHQQELENLKSSHATQIEQSKKDSEAAHVVALESLVASHKTQLESSQTESASTLARELETLRSAHGQELEASRANADAKLASELNALKNGHVKELEQWKVDMEAKFAADLEALQSTHSKSLDESKAEGESRLAQELEALKAAHSKQIDTLKTETDATLSREIESIKASHAQELENLKRETDAAHAAELAALGLLHTQQMTNAKSEADASLARELASLKQAHAGELDVLRSEHAAAHAKELEGFKAALANQLESSKSEGDAAHTQQIEALKAANFEIVEAHKRDSEKALEQALESAKSTHERELESLKSEHVATRTKEVEALSTKHASELEDLRTTMDAAKVKAVEDLSSQHQQHIAVFTADGASAKTKEINELSSSYDKQIEALKAEAAAAKLKELEDLAAAHRSEIQSLKTETSSSKEQALEALALKHKEQIDALNREASSSKTKELDELKANHATDLESLKGEHASAIAKLTEELAAGHALKLEALRGEHETSKTAELAALSTQHDRDLESLRTEHGTSQTKELEALKAEHATLVASLRTEHQETLDKALEDLKAGHAKDIDSLNNSHSTSLEAAIVAIKSGHGKELDNLKAANETSLAQALDTASLKHAEALEAQKAANETSLSQALATANVKHTEVLEAQQASHASSLAQALDSLNVKHAEALEAHQAANESSLAQALSAAQAKHAEALGTQQAENEAALAQALDAARVKHAEILEAQRAESLAERKQLLATHAEELEALRRSLAVTHPALGYSSVSTIETKPVAEPESLRAMAIPRETEAPHTPASDALGIFTKRRKDAVEPIIAEDDTRQSPSAVPGPETPESQKPFKEISTNTDARVGRKQGSHQASQTTLTSDGIDRLFKHQRRSSQDSVKIAIHDDGTPATVRHRRSQEMPASPSKSKPASGVLSSTQRPSSASSAMSARQTLPPLPANHKEAIEAARTGSSHGSKGAMGPPAVPASAYRSSVQSRASLGRPQSPMSGRATPTSRGLRTGSSHGYADVAVGSARLSTRSRRSSVSSFASEVDTRFGIRSDMGMGVAGFVGPHTDPRMIQAITQTMIGEYLWKYTRKTGRGELSDNRHRRYFWVHPYTRTLYWSDRDPSAAGRSELRAKSVPIEAVRVVADDNPMPPGLHHKSLIVISPGRAIKFTCTTGQRHETWFNALSYLLLRTGEEGQADAEEMAGNITQDDVDEFNPSFGGRRSAASRRAPPSLSSYNSRTTRTESPVIDMTIPTLTPTHERMMPPRSSTLSRLSGYLGRTGTPTGIFSSTRSRSHGDNIQDTAIYEASAVNDSAEDVREMMEQQEREADRLENVRACCDGKHDVGTLSHTTKRHRHSHGHTHTHPSRSTTPTPVATVRSRA